MLQKKINQLMFFALIYSFSCGLTIFASAGKNDLSPLIQNLKRSIDNTQSAIDNEDPQVSELLLEAERSLGQLSTGFATIRPFGTILKKNVDQANKAFSTTAQNDKQLIEQLTAKLNELKTDSTNIKAAPAAAPAPSLARSAAPAMDLQPQLARAAKDLEFEKGRSSKLQANVKQLQAQLKAQDNVQKENAQLKKDLAARPSKEQLDKLANQNQIARAAAEKAGDSKQQQDQLILQLRAQLNDQQKQLVQANKKENDCHLGDEKQNKDLEALRAQSVALQQQLAQANKKIQEYAQESEKRALAMRAAAKTAQEEELTKDKELEAIRAELNGLKKQLDIEQQAAKDAAQQNQAAHIEREKANADNKAKDKALQDLQAKLTALEQAYAKEKEAAQRTLDALNAAKKGQDAEKSQDAAQKEQIDQLRKQLDAATQKFAAVGEQRKQDDVAEIKVKEDWKRSLMLAEGALASAQAKLQETSKQLIACRADKAKLSAELKDCTDEKKSTEDSLIKTNQLLEDLQKKLTGIKSAAVSLQSKNDIIKQKTAQ